MHTDRPRRIAVIGYGLAGSCFHAPFVATTSGLELAAIVTSSAERQAQAAREHPGVRVIDSASALWDQASDLDAVVVAAPNRAHAPLARAAIDAGLAVVVDKPLATSAAEARALIRYAASRGRLLTVYQNRRWDGDFVTLRHLLLDGAVGDPLRFESRFERWRPAARPGWRQLPSPEEAGGLLFDLGSHLIDQALQLFGPVARVYAELDRRQSAAVDNDSFVALTHRSGVRSHLFMSTMAAQAGPRFRLLGTQGAYVKHGMDVQEDALRAGGRPDQPRWGEEPVESWGDLGCGDKIQRVPTSAGAYQEFYRAFERALRGDGPPPVDPNDAALALDVIEAAHRADAARQVVEMVAYG